MKFMLVFFNLLFSLSVIADEKSYCAVNPDAYLQVFKIDTTDMNNIKFQLTLSDKKVLVFKLKKAEMSHSEMYCGVTTVLDTNPNVSLAFHIGGLWELPFPKELCSTVEFNWDLAMANASIYLDYTDRLNGLYYEIRTPTRITATDSSGVSIQKMLYKSCLK